MIWCRTFLFSLCGCVSWLSENKKSVPDKLSETVIISYYRGTTQFGVSPTFARTIIRSGLITGSVPGGSYYTIMLLALCLPRIQHMLNILCASIICILGIPCHDGISDSPSKVHSASCSMLRFHHPQLSVISQ